MNCQDCIKANEWDKCYLCPFVDYDKETDTKVFCSIKNEFSDKQKICDIPPVVMRKYVLGKGGKE